MVDKHYLCKCNMCDSILFDENSNGDSPIDITTIEQPIDFMVRVHDGEEFYWGCPNCYTDFYLMDLTTDDFKK